MKIEDKKLFTVEDVKFYGRCYAKIERQRIIALIKEWFNGQDNISKVIEKIEESP